MSPEDLAALQRVIRVELAALAQAFGQVLGELIQQGNNLVAQQEVFNDSLAMLLDGQTLVEKTLAAMQEQQRGEWWRGNDDDLAGEENDDDE